MSPRHDRQAGDRDQRPADQPHWKAPGRGPCQGLRRTPTWQALGGARSPPVRLPVSRRGARPSISLPIGKESAEYAAEAFAETGNKQGSESKGQVFQ
jgi:hypothetical protein